MNRSETVARWFGLEGRSARKMVRPPIWPGEGQVILVSGASGAGKSTLLRQYRKGFGGRWIDLDRLSLPPRPVVELFPRLSLNEALRLLRRVGLAEAQTYVQSARRLSAGQQWRLRLALGLAEAQQRGGEGLVCLGCDEFATVLDRVTAAIVARALRRFVSETPGLCAIVASSHDDLERALCPDAVVRCDFGEVTWAGRGTSTS